MHLEIARAGLLRPAAGPIGDWIESASEKAQLDTIGTVYARARGCAPRSDRLAADFVLCLAITDQGVRRWPMVMQRWSYGVIADRAGTPQRAA